MFYRLQTPLTLDLSVEYVDSTSHFDGCQPSAGLCVSGYFKNMKIQRMKFTTVQFAFDSGFSILLYPVT